jgi:hypothetical protein
MALQELRRVQDEIRRNGRFSGGPAYWEAAAAIADQPKRSVAGNRIVSHASALTTSERIGEPPEGFGKGFKWDRMDAEVLFEMFINPADPLGIVIEGVEPGDKVTVLTVAGVASFAKNTGNPLASSIIGLVGRAAEIGAPLLGYGAATPFINVAAQWAQQQFAATGAPEKCRDGFGVDPGSGHKARAEGGVLITMPGGPGSGPFYSGDDSTEGRKRWIKSPGDRDYLHNPDHVGAQGFFPVRDQPAQNNRRVARPGEIFVTPWDWKFADNAGVYRLKMQITRNPPLLPID